MKPDEVDSVDTEPDTSFAVLVSNTAGTGTAFFARTHDALALYTVAHNLGDYPNRASRFLAVAEWSWLDPVLRVHDPDGSRLELPVFDLAASARRPLFAHHATAPGTIADFVKFEVVSDELRQLSTKFPSVNLSSPALTLAAKEELICIGFPATDARGLSDPDDASLREASRCRGAYLGLADGLHWASIDIRSGFSGGPVFNSARQFVGMAAGRHERLMPDPTVAGWFVTANDLAAI